MGLGHTHSSCLQVLLLEGTWDTEPVPGSGSPLKELTTLHNPGGSASHFSPSNRADGCLPLKGALSLK